MRRLLACTHSTFDPASRFRIAQFVPHLARAGWQVTLRPNRPNRERRPRWPVPVLRRPRGWVRSAVRRASRARDVRDAQRFDAVFVNRDLLGLDLRCERALLARNPRVVFDFDDAIFLGDKAAHAEWMCRHAAWVTAGNDYLADFARRFTDRVTVLPTVVDVDRYALPVHDPPRARVRVGWCGSPLSIQETLVPHLPMLARLQAALDFELVVMTRPRPRLPDCGLTWRYVRWSPGKETRLAAHLDVGVMPLVDDEFQRGKCGLKLLQYMAAGVPAVASPVGVNTRIVRHGERGFLATTEREWHAALAPLVADAALRRAIGMAGRRHCEREYSLARWLPTLVDVLDRVATAPVEPRTASLRAAPSGAFSAPMQA